MVIFLSVLMAFIVGLAPKGTSIVMLVLGATAYLCQMVPARAEQEHPAYSVQNVRYAGFAGRLQGGKRLKTSGTGFPAKTGTDKEFGAQKTEGRGQITKSSFTIKTCHSLH